MSARRLGVSMRGKIIVTFFILFAIGVCSAFMVAVWKMIGGYLNHIETIIFFGVCCPVIIVAIIVGAVQIGRDNLES